jgi:hypothetical protein
MDIRVRSKDTLIKACHDLGLEYITGQETFRWYGRYLEDSESAEDAIKLGVKAEDFGKCRDAIRVPGAKYEIGVIAALDGDGYMLLFDAYCYGGLEKQLGKNCERLYGQYATQLATEELELEGFVLAEDTQAEGERELVFVRRS